jgi:purine-binding chemotaxis protein CheW
MADARRRARREGGAAPVEAREPEAPAELVFGADEPAEPVAESAAAGEPSPIALPASGLAEDILRQLEAQSAPPGPSAEPSAPARLELPASGLAEDILARAEAASVPGESAAPAAASAEPAASPSLPGGHSLSFFAAPAQEQRKAVEATEHVATFFLDREEYGVDVRQVQEIRRLTEITTVPRAPEFVRGVINLRGRILPVLDLRRKLGLGEVAAKSAARIVVVHVRQRVLGLLVDGASQVLKIPVSRVEPPPEEVVERGGDYIRGVAKLDDRLIILVDLERLLAQELRAAQAARAAEANEAS